MQTIPLDLSNLNQTLDQVCKTHQPIVLSREQGEPVVVISLADFESSKETSYLLDSPTNSQRLLQAVEQLGAGQGIVRELSL